MWSGGLDPLAHAQLVFASFWSKGVATGHISDYINIIQRSNCEKLKLKTKK